MHLPCSLTLPYTFIPYLASSHTLFLAFHGFRQNTGVSNLRLDASLHSCLAQPHRPLSSILISFVHPQSCEGNSALGWMFEVREDLKNERDYKQTNMPLAAIPDWTLFSCQCFLFNVYTVSRHSHPSPWKENENPHTPYALTSTNVHMSQLLFLTLIPATLSLSLSRTHTNHAGSERCWGCNLSGIGLITA